MCPVEYFFACPAAGNTKIPEIGIKIVKLLNAAGLNYTVSSQIVDTGTEVDHIAVHTDLSKKMLLEWESAAQKLGCRYVMIAECGCDVRTMYIEVAETLGRPFALPIISLDTILHDAIVDGKLPVEKFSPSITFHDPCYVTRLSGMGEKYRETLSLLTEDFREMTPNREHNYCCNGGAGMLRLPENKPLRLAASIFKARQIKESGAQYVTTPCAVCYLSLKEICEHYSNESASCAIQAPDEQYYQAHEAGSPLGGEKVMVFFELVYDCVERALAKRGELGRMLMPSSLATMHPEERRKYSLAGYLEQLLKQRNAIKTLEELGNDPKVKAFAETHAGFWEYLHNLKQNAGPVLGREPLFPIQDG